MVTSDKLSDDNMDLLFEKLHAGQEMATGHAGGGKHDLIANQVFGSIDAVGFFEAGGFQQYGFIP